MEPFLKSGEEISVKPGGRFSWDWSGKDRAGSALLLLARSICRWLPPLAAQRVRCGIYPYRFALREHRLAQVRAVTGGWFEGWTSDFHAYRMLVHGYFDWRNVAICAAVCSRGDVVFEIGANVGTETVCFADVVGPTRRVIAVEPDGDNVRLLQRIASLNGWEHVDIFTAAASDCDGEVWFETTPERTASGIGRVVGQANGGTVVRVRSVCLDTLRRNFGRRVAALSIDVEGYERAVLKGARELLRGDRPTVVLEASPKLLARNGWGLADLKAEMDTADYHCYSIGQLGLRKTDGNVGRAENWLCLPAERAGLEAKIQSVIRRAGLLPLVRGLNPPAGGSIG